MTKPEKIIIGVHGVGDQTGCETIQAIHRRFARYFGVPPALPLGKLRSAIDEAGVYLWDVPGKGMTIGFAEVYWAGIARGVANEGYTLEEPRKWAKALVERVSERCAGTRLSTADRMLLVRVLREMIETISVLKRLLFLAEKGGVFSFDLDRILTHYVSDVQVVTEYDGFRRQIVDNFLGVLERVSRLYPQAEIHIIAHSEGTVISLLGLLQALTAGREEFCWIRRVRSFTTMGSPIDKHFFLWPELWKEFRYCREEPSEKQQITWRNYYDMGDPVGFKLDTAREELKSRGFPFATTADDEVGFSRYPLPGKAHVDYWEDDEVFAHIIEGSVCAANGHTSSKPGNRPGSQVIGYVMPYLAGLLCLFSGVYFLYAAVLKCLGDSVSAVTIAKNVALVTSLLAGVTVMARIPRLTRCWQWHLFGLFLFLVSSTLFHRFFDADVAMRLAWPLSELLHGHEKTFLVSLSAAIAGAATFIGLMKPAWSARSLLVPGGIAVAYIITMRLVHEWLGESSQGSIMPVVIAGGVFLYLWWIATILFDLTFVWHRYIRYSQAMNLLKGIWRAEESRMDKPDMGAIMAGERE